MYPTITLKSDKEAAVLHRHPWVFSGAIDPSSPEVPHGGLVRVAAANGTVIGTGTYSHSSSIAVRVFDFGEAAIDRAWFAKRLAEAERRRTLLGYGPGTDTTGYRVVFGESDGIPGLIVDRYGDTLVFQSSTAGMDLLLPDVAAAAREVFSPAAIVERSDVHSRKEEGLKEKEGVLFGTPEDSVEFKEHGMTFFADPLHGQKTGFFLDQKDLRSAIRGFRADGEVLNLFSYSGASGIAALMGGAASVTNVDSSAAALALCARHAQANGFGPERMRTVESDVFQYFAEKREPGFDVVLMDPPALIKSKKESEEGKKAYHFLNRAAMRLVRDGGIFVTSSCSRYLDEEDFAFLLRRASVQAGVRLASLGAYRQAPDHPISIYFPEGAYLKSYAFEVRR